MDLSKNHLDLARHVAFELNSDLPAEYQSEVFQESVRASKQLAKSNLTNRKVLLVGGAGYIGSVLTGQLLKSGYQVRTLDLLLYGNQSCVVPYLNDANYEFVHGDLTDTRVLESALKSVTDVIILAGLVGDPITKKYPEASQKINQDGMLQAIRTLNGKGLNKVIFISTCSNYGLIQENVSADESTELKPLSLYAKSKVRLEEELLLSKGKVDYHATILRFATAFGLSPRMRFDLTVSEFTREMYLKRDLLVFDAQTWRPYCHVMDFSTALRRVLEAPVELVDFEVFNAGGDANNFTKQMIVTEIKKFIPEAPVQYKEHGSDPRNYKVNFSKIRTRLHFEPKMTLTAGVTELLAALKQGMFADFEKQRNFYGNYEITY